MKFTSPLIAAAATGILSALSGCAQDQPANSPSASEQTTAMPAKHGCKGQNECKGQGGCKTDAHGCKGQNACKGQGGCKST